MNKKLCMNEVVRRLQEDPDNRMCFECSSLEVTHASVNLGIMLCMHCAKQHAALGINISHVKSLKDQWTTRHLKPMSAGGNTFLKAFFDIYSIPLNDPNKLLTIACEYYREMLKLMSEGAQIMMITPSKEEGSMLLEEFRPNQLPPSPPQVPHPLEPSSTTQTLSKSKTFTIFNEITNNALNLISKSVKICTQKEFEGLEWSSQQSKQLIRKMPNREALIDEAKQIYSTLKHNLNFTHIKQETLKCFKKSKSKPVLTHKHST